MNKWTNESAWECSCASSGDGCVCMSISCIYVPTCINTYIHVYLHTVVDIGIASSALMLTVKQPWIYSRIDPITVVEGCPNWLKANLTIWPYFLIQWWAYNPELCDFVQYLRKRSLILSLSVTEAAPSSIFCWCQNDNQEKSLPAYEADIPEGRVKRK